MSGTVARENSAARLGAHHTLDLELQRWFVIEKGEGWDSVARELLKEACETERRAELWAVVMGEGIANVAVITEHQTILKQRIEVPVPRKRNGGMDTHNKGMQRFLQATLDTVLRFLDLGNRSPGDKTVPLLLASPGFTAQVFLSFIKDHATRTNNKQLLALLPSILVAHSSSPHLHSLPEILASPAITAKLSDAKYARETALMDTFYEYLRQDDGRAWYGPREVERAVERGAVGRGGGVLLISNALFRAQSIAERKRWVALVDRVREVEGGEVRVLSSLHESGKRLEQLGNVAAICTWAVEGLDESEDEDDGDTGGGEGDELVV